MTEFQLYLRIAKKWWWLILAVTLLASAAGWGYASTVLPIYQASASLLVSARSSADDYSSVMAGEKMAETYKELLTKRPVIEQAARDLGLDPEQVFPKVEARLISRTLIIELVVKDANPRMAAAIANTIVMVFMDTLRDAVNVRRGDIGVVELATPPTVPVSPQTTRIVVVAGLAGLVSAAGVVSGVEFARDPLETVQDVRRSLSLPTLAVVPRDRRDVSNLWARHAGRDDSSSACATSELMPPLVVYGLLEKDDSSSVPPTGDQTCSTPRRTSLTAPRGQPRMPISLSAPDSAATEAYRTLRTWMQFSYRGDVLPTLLVTSPVSRKDTARVTANLGVVLAQAGIKTLLLDADLRQPALEQTGLCQVCQLSAEPGLSELLADADDWPQYVVDTDVPDLHLLPAGLSPSDPLGLLSSPRMTYLIRQLEQHFQVLLIHGPPILAASDALVLATQVAGTVLVIESGTTMCKSATRALALLENAEVNVLGTVLTRVRARSLKSGSYSDLSKPVQPPQLQIETETSLSWLENAETISAYRL